MPGLRRAKALKIICRALGRSEEHTSELQSRLHLVCRLLLEKKKTLLIYLSSRRNSHTCLPVHATSACTHVSTVTTPHCSSGHKPDKNFIHPDDCRRSIHMCT